MKTGTDVALLAVGPQVFDAMEASVKLSQSGISCEVVNCRFVKPMDEAYLGSIIGRFNQVITLEEGIITGGFGEGVAAWLAVKGYKGEVQNIGLPIEFVEHGPRDLLLNKLGVCEVGIIEAVHTVKNPFEIKE